MLFWNFFNDAFTLKKMRKDENSSPVRVRLPHPRSKDTQGKFVSVCLSVCLSV